MVSNLQHCVLSALSPKQALRWQFQISQRAGMRLIVNDTWVFPMGSRRATVKGSPPHGQILLPSVCFSIKACGTARLSFTCFAILRNFGLDFHPKLHSWPLPHRSTRQTLKLRLPRNECSLNRGTTVSNQMIGHQCTLRADLWPKGGGLLDKKEATS